MTGLGVPPIENASARMTALMQYHDGNRPMNSSGHLITGVFLEVLCVDAKVSLGLCKYAPIDDGHAKQDQDEFEEASEGGAGR